MARGNAPLRLPSIVAMKHDLAKYLPDMTRREKVLMWVTYYWRPTRRWMPKVSMWWAYNVLRYPKLPPIEKDRVALHFGFVDGIPPCMDGPICAEHGWKLSPAVTGEGADGD